MKHRLVIETELPKVGQDFAPKEFEGSKQIANVFELLVTSMRTNLKDPGVLMWCGRKIISITYTQKEEPDGVHTSTASGEGVVAGDKSGKG